MIDHRLSVFLRDIVPLFFWDIVQVFFRDIIPMFFWDIVPMFFREYLFVFQKHLRAGISCQNSMINNEEAPEENMGAGRDLFVPLFFRKQTISRGLGDIPGGGLDIVPDGELFLRINSKSNPPAAIGYTQ